MNYYNGTFQSSAVDSVQELFNRIVAYMPNILAAIIFLLLGWIIATFVGRLVYKVLAIIKIDHLANRLGMEHLSQRTGRRLSIASLGEWLVKWFVLIATLVATADVLGLQQVSLFLYGRVFPYFGNVIIAVAIMLIGIVAASFLGDIVKGTLAAGEMNSANALSSVTRWAIIVFAVIAALAQLNIATAFLQDLFRGVVVMLAIAGGISFGLGGQGHAKKVLDMIERDIK
jgi:hypothetical protein